MQPTGAISALQTFCAPIIEQVQSLVSRPDMASKKELVSCSDALERLNMYLNINSHLSGSLPPQCSSTAAEIWRILDMLLLKYGNSAVAERTCSTIRRGLTFFGSLSLPLAPEILDRMTSSFEETGVSGYIWIAGRIPDLLRQSGTNGAAQDNVKVYLQRSFESITNKLVGLLSVSTAAEVQDSKQLLNQVPGRSSLNSV